MRAPECLACNAATDALCQHVCAPHSLYVYAEAPMRGRSLKYTYAEAPMIGRAPTCICRSSYEESCSFALGKPDSFTVQIEKNTISGVAEDLPPLFSSTSAIEDVARRDGHLQELLLIEVLYDVWLPRDHARGHSGRLGLVVHSGGEAAEAV